MCSGLFHVLTGLGKILLKALQNPTPYSNPSGLRSGEETETQGEKLPNTPRLDAWQEPGKCQGVAHSQTGTAAKAPNLCQ